MARKIGLPYLCFFYWESLLKSCSFLFNFPMWHILENKQKQPLLGAKYHTIRIQYPNTVISAHPSGCLYKLFPLCCFLPFFNANRDVLFRYIAFVKNYQFTANLPLYFTYETLLVPRTVFGTPEYGFIHSNPSS